MKKGIDAPIIPIIFIVVGIINVMPAWSTQSPYNFIFSA